MMIVSCNYLHGHVQAIKSCETMPGVAVLESVGFSPMSPPIGPAMMWHMWRSQVENEL